MKTKTSAHYQREYRKRLREQGLVKGGGFSGAQRFALFDREAAARGRWSL